MFYLAHEGIEHAATNSTSQFGTIIVVSLVTAAFGLVLAVVLTSLGKPQSKQKRES
jgi:hypothetical protein